MFAAFRIVRGLPKRTTDDDTTTTTRDANPAPYATVRPVPRARRVDDRHGGAVVIVAGGLRSLRVSRREAQGGIQTEATYRSDDLCIDT